MLLQNPHLVICSTLFTVGQSRQCNLWLKDPSVSTTLCKLRHIKVREIISFFTALLQMLLLKIGVMVDFVLFCFWFLFFLFPEYLVVFYYYVLKLSVTYIATAWELFCCFTRNHGRQRCCHC